MAPFAGLNHVVYCDNFYSSAPLVDMLGKGQIFLAGTSANGFPVSLQKAKPPKGTYFSDTRGVTIYKAGGAVAPPLFGGSKKVERPSRTTAS